MTQVYKGLQFKLKEGNRPHGRPRIYFCCHPEDFETYFDAVTEEILELQPDAAFWYYEPADVLPQKDEFLADLSQMQLFVIPVTGKFLNEDCQARITEFTFAMEKHIPVLPLLKERGLGRTFNDICGDLQYLDKYESENDPTAIPYSKRLQSFLDSVLIEDELARRVRAAFDAYVFLSYRKKDRALAQQVMHLIHENEYCRDIAIWYDEFLLPGENFNNAILQAMEKCEVFALVVTPSLLEDPNYVQTAEYPEARDRKMKILPVEIIETNYRALSDLYDGIGDTIRANDSETLGNRIGELLGNVALRTGIGDPVHDYLVGLAYHAGIDMEIDHDRGTELIESAAKEGVIEACEKLVAMYSTGDGVSINYGKALEWRKKAVDLLHEKTVINDTPENLYAFYKASIDLTSGIYVDSSYSLEPKYKEWSQWISGRLEEFVHLTGTDAEMDQFLKSRHLKRDGEALEAKGDFKGALDIYNKAVEMSRELAAESGSEWYWYNHLLLLVLLLENSQNIFTGSIRKDYLTEIRDTADKLLDRFGQLRFAELGNYARSYLEEEHLYKKEAPLDCGC